MMRLHVGGGTCRGALTVFPVWGEYAGPRGYSTDHSGLDLAERDGGVAVSVLVATNPSPRPVLLLEGQILEGGWQNRALVRSTLLPAGSRSELDVVCVEAGRWDGGRSHRSRGRRTGPRVRSAFRAQGRAQGEVWRRVSEYDTRYGANDTSSFTAHLDRAEADVRRLVAELRPLPGQVGVVIGIEGQTVGAEGFDSPTTLRREFESVIAEAGLDALGHRPVETPSRRARRFIDHAGRVPLRAVAPAGEGLAVVGGDERVDVSALAWRDRLVHMAMHKPQHPVTAGV